MAVKLRVAQRRPRRRRAPPSSLSASRPSVGMLVQLAGTCPRPHRRPNTDPIQASLPLRSISQLSGRGLWTQSTIFLTRRLLCTWQTAIFQHPGTATRVTSTNRWLTDHSGQTCVLDINSNSYGNDWTSIEVIPFGAAPANAVVEGLYGCISVILVSHHGEIGGSLRA
jgi:hypothetical protein